ncbi:chorismate mutase [Membranihabitans marinus]|uniref:chorismate mutase n=1 Tax=Membranihabitans marinus TaxID=1227546 RepID=UPI001F004488|nr:chorismate mutase [Membranihabitans marinus]
MNLKPIFENTDRPIQILGPCSAETEEQVLATAQQLKDANAKVDLFRAGIWKPRTRPNSFEGVGPEGLQWLKKVREQYGYKITTEVANTQHTFEALKAQVDVLWLGARTTVNPFSVQEVADALKGVDVPVLVKNPINPDLKLWMGAIERLYNVGITRIGAIHRGFSKFGKSVYRNTPQWQIALELKRNFPDIEIITDSSHICGNRTNLYEISQFALDLNIDGIMLETHPNPDEAWSDAAQQVTPKFLQENILSKLIVRKETETDPLFLHNIEDLRSQIDLIDKEVIQLFADRMNLAEKIGEYKKQNNIAIYQQGRWSDILEKAMEMAQPKGLSEEFINRILKAVHQESIDHQEKVMQGKQENA